MSPNAKVVVPYEAAGLVGAAAVLVDAMKGAGTVVDPQAPVPANGKAS